MTDNKKDGVPSAGTSSTRDALDEMKKTSSGLYAMIGVKGKASDNFPGVTRCSGKDRDTYFRIYHPWSFYPTSKGDLDEALRRLKAELPKHGWEIVEYGPDTSRNKNISLTADNDKKKVSVNVVQMKKNDRPKLSFHLVSGCYKVPDGEKVDRY
ncbi:hypothetical protein [Streptomyces sp. CC224B]|uniref:hypothetical protein n=1 Tax=Streptomyces sp. CC224B TaxID=3044571 RepID=UPI0024A8FA7F|nr:hypothetical protein [Streptomyces sp. CC224B]